MTYIIAASAKSVSEMLRLISLRQACLYVGGIGHPWDPGRALEAVSGRNSAPPAHGTSVDLPCISHCCLQ